MNRNFIKQEMNSFDRYVYEEPYFFLCVREGEVKFQRSGHEISNRKFTQRVYPKF